MVDNSESQQNNLIENDNREITAFLGRGFVPQNRCASAAYLLQFSQAAVFTASLGLLLDNKTRAISAHYIMPHLPEIIIAVNMSLLAVSFMDYFKESDPVSKKYKLNQCIKQLFLTMIFSTIGALFAFAPFMQIIKVPAFIAMQGVKILSEIHELYRMQIKLNQADGNPALVSHYKSSRNAAAVRLLGGIAFMTFAVGVMALGITTGSLGAVFITAAIASITMGVVGVVKKMRAQQPEVPLVSEGVLMNRINNKLEELTGKRDGVGLFYRLEQAKHIEKIAALRDLKNLLQFSGPRDELDYSVKNLIKEHKKLFDASLKTSEVFLIFNLAIKHLKDRVGEESVVGDESVVELSELPRLSFGS